MSQPQLSRGAIIRAEGLVGVLWATSVDCVYVIPMVIRGAGLHRSDVRCEAEPLLPSNGALRAGSLRKIKSRVTMTGRVGDAMVAALEQALRREVRALQFEARFPTESACETSVRF
jgi:hypothetical protein